MIILKSKDSVKCDNENIAFTVDGRDFDFKVAEIEKISIFTINRGPFGDDVAVAVFLMNEIFLIKSEHEIYESFIFDDLSNIFPINYQAIINASVSTDNAEFILFAK